MRYRIAALLLGALVFLLIIGQLVDLTAFTLGSPIDLPADTNSAVADWLGSYRAIDLLIQVTLLLAAVMAASAMFRASKREAE
ncbi:hypothetical protein EU527_11375 [Candidatus Thorarchaeota archaeon]|nr:MAG: hypothetical protein EU527_11375 [Candidatus Thorarchaeota archaeon]